MTEFERIIDTSKSKGLKAMPEIWGLSVFALIAIAHTLFEMKGEV